VRLDESYEIGGGNRENGGDAQYGAEGRVHFAAFKKADVCPMVVRIQSERFLRNAFFRANLPEGLGECLLGGHGSRPALSLSLHPYLMLREGRA
jgi:hypothetical protein